MHRNTARGESKDSYVVGIASERGNVFFPHPLEGCNLVHVGVVPLQLVWMFPAKRGKGEEPEPPDAVICGDQDDAMFCELGPRGERRGTGPAREPAPVDPEHHGKLCTGRGGGRPPQIEIQAIFRRGWRHRHRPRAWSESCLCTIRGELASIAHSLPSRQRLWRTPTPVACRRSCEGNSLEAGVVSFGHSAQDAVGSTNRCRRG